MLFPAVSWLVFALTLLISTISNNLEDKGPQSHLATAYFSTSTPEVSNQEVVGSKMKRSFVLNISSFEHYCIEFNRKDRELYSQFIPNQHVWAFLSQNIPFIDLPDKEIERTYYFRWWTFRKHIKYVPYVKTFVITEFLPVVSWSGLFNTISCAAGHHFREGRWLHNSSYMDSYARFWFRPINGGNPRQYSFWAADSIRALAMITGNTALTKELLPGLIRNFESLVQTNFDPKIGLFFNTDNRDGMESSIGGLHAGRGYRPTLNSYMYGDAIAISRIAHSARISITKEIYRAKAQALKENINSKLWDSSAQFYKVLPYGKAAVKIANSTSWKLSHVDVRELHGYTPWYFKLPDLDKIIAWSQLVDPKGFFAMYGLTTAEQRHSKFVIDYSKSHECQWNGPSWPYATSMTLTSLGHLLQSKWFNESLQFEGVSKDVFYRAVKRYAMAHRRRLDGSSDEYVPWIDENINPHTGDWISRTLLRTWRNGTWSKAKGGEERGKDYNHSTFTDIIISFLIGFKSKTRNSFEIRPLIPADTWDYFCIDQLKYRGRYLTILYDVDGQRYNIGKGMRVFSNGILVASSPFLSNLIVNI